MINYIKYSIYLAIFLAITGFFAYLKHWHEIDKAKAVNAAIQEIQIQQQSIVITQQNTVITEQAEVFKKSQEIAQASVKNAVKISLAKTISEKVSVKYTIIDEINCIIINLNQVCTNISSVQ